MDDANSLAMHIVHSAPNPTPSCQTEKLLLDFPVALIQTGHDLTIQRSVQNLPWYALLEESSIE